MNRRRNVCELRLPGGWLCNIAGHPVVSQLHIFDQRSHVPLPSERLAGSAAGHSERWPAAERQNDQACRVEERRRVQQAYGRGPGQSRPDFCERRSHLRSDSSGEICTAGAFGFRRRFQSHSRSSRVQELHRLVLRRSAEAGRAAEVGRTAQRAAHSGQIEASGNRDRS